MPTGLGRRLLVEAGLLAGTLLVATFLAFVLTVKLPGDPAVALFRARFGEGVPATPERLHELRRETGFDEPIVVQYAEWLGGAVRGDMGHSFVTRQPVFATLIDRLPATLLLAFGSLIVGLAAALVTALVAARSRIVRYFVAAVTQLGISLPDYFLALLLVLVFAVRLQVLPVAGWGSAATVVLPMAMLALYPWALLTRVILAGIRENQSADWVRTARAHGLRERVVLTRHILPHTMVPVVSLLGVLGGSALSSTLIAEVVFAIPGAGRLLFEAIAQRDIPVIQAALLTQVGLAIAVNKLAALSLPLFDPTLRNGGAS
jgi:peptide/nickel transport system permease protein